MIELSKEEMARIKAEVKQEFPFDDALQQVHIARCVINRKAELMGVSIITLIKQLAALENSDWQQ
jgi:hypothetical protein